MKQKKKVAEAFSYITIALLGRRTHLGPTHTAHNVG